MSRPRSRSTLAIAVALPGLILAAAGTTHPATLTQNSAHHWWVMHVWLIPVFPLLGLALLTLYRGRRDVAAGLVAGAVFMYAVFYSVIDLIAGVAAGYVMAAAGTADQPPAVASLFHIGNSVGDVGRWAVIAVGVIVAADQMIRHARPTIAPGVLLVAGTIIFSFNHIYRWWGVVSVVMISVATAWLFAIDSRAREQGISHPETRS